MPLKRDESRADSLNVPRQRDELQRAAQDDRHGEDDELLNAAPGRLDPRAADAVRQRTVCVHEHLGRGRDGELSSRGQGRPRPCRDRLGRIADEVGFCGDVVRLWSVHVRDQGRLEQAHLAIY